MDNVVLKEKRKNLFNLGINATELYTNNAFLKITHFFSEADLLQFVENAAVSELRISKTTVLEKIKSFIEPANSNIQIMNILQMLDCSIKSSYQHADLTKIKNDIIATIVDQRMEELNSLLDVSLQAKIAYYDTSV
jgi:hypothetical protein